MCDDNYNIAKEYICPSLGCQKGAGKKKRRSVSQLGGDCFYAGESMAINKACPPNDKVGLSEKAWDMRGGADGFSMMPGQAVGGMPGFLRYTGTCRPIFPGQLTQNGGGLITKLSYYSKNGKGGGSNCESCSFSMPLQKGGVNLLPLKNATIALANMITPMGKNSLATLIVLLFLNYLQRKRTISSKKQLGGGMHDYIKLLLPMSKNNLVVLASLLLLNHFILNKKSRSKKQKGGNMIMSEVSKLLAPLGVNSLGASIILVILNRAIRKTKKKVQKGGNILHPLIKLVAPLGINMFTATGILVILKKMFKLKSDRKLKKMKGGNMSMLMVELKNLLAPLGVNTFLATASLVGLKKLKTN